MKGKHLNLEAPTLMARFAFVPERGTLCGSKGCFPCMPPAMTVLRRDAQAFLFALSFSLKQGTGRMYGAAALAALIVASVLSIQAAHAQGILTVTPVRTTTTLAGIGTVGLAGNNSAATSATLAAPSAVAYDGSGNLYLADANNHSVREVVKLSGNIVTIAGTGIAGFAGDGAAATAAQLDTPTGVAVDASGNVYIADSHNQRIRMVSAAGTITTVAGTGTKGFSGDNAAATAATLNLPSAVAVDVAGTLYIADTNNQRVRKVMSGTITTFAGTGEQSFTGDGAAATAATLDSPTGVAVDAVGNVYIADCHNQRIREVTAGNITTLAGSGTPTFAGGFSGEGASSTAATLAKPTGVSADAAGNLYIADTNNQRIRQLGGGVIATVFGSGQQGFGADGGPSTAAILNAPRTAAPDVNGNLAVADTMDQRVRSGTLPTLAYTSQAVGIASAVQAVTLANTGSAAITVSTITFTGPFILGTGGTCPAAPVALAPATSCTENVAFLPSATGNAGGSVVFSGTGVINQTVLLTGATVASTTTTTLSSSVPQPVVNQSLTFTAQVRSVGVGVPTGTVQFYANSLAIGSPVSVPASGLAALTTSFNLAGAYAITALYSGDASFGTSTSATLSQPVTDFSLSLAASSPSGSSQTVQPGQTATYTFTLTALSVPFPYPTSLAATGQPSGSVVTFTPQTLTLGSTTQGFTMSVKTPAQSGALHRMEVFGGGTVAMGLLLLPFGLRMGRRGRELRPLLYSFIVLMSFAVLGLTGCGPSGLSGQSQTYNITVTATASASGGATLTHTSSVILAVQ